MSAQAKDARLTELQERREGNAGTQIMDDQMPAGSPMHYYCEVCGVLVSTKPEGWWQNPPPPHCSFCKDLIDDGVVRYTDTFGDWLDQNNKERYAT